MMGRFVFLLVVLLCVGTFDFGASISPNIPGKIRRNKRHVGETSVQSVLESFISRLDTMQKLIQKQNKDLGRQNKEIKDLKWYIRRKGTQERLEEVERDVNHQTTILKRVVDIKSLKEFKNSVDKFEKRTKGLSAAVNERKRVINDIYARIVLPDGKIVCRNTFTSWNKQANYKIGALEKHHIECSDNEFLQRFLLERKDGALDSPVRFKYRCCRYNVKDKWQRTPKRTKQQ